VYVFELDTFMKSNCFDECEKVWPIYQADPNKPLTVGTGVDKTLLQIA